MKCISLIVTLAAFALAGCQSEAAKKAQFVAFCSTHGFGADQCEVLYALRKDISDDVSDAESNGLTTGMAIGGGR